MSSSFEPTTSAVVYKPLASRLRHAGTANATGNVILDLLGLKWCALQNSAYSYKSTDLENYFAGLEPANHKGHIMALWPMVIKPVF